MGTTIQLLSFLVTLQLVFEVKTLEEIDWINIGRCRISCAKRFLQPPYKDEDCQQRRRCNMCWQTCDTYIREDKHTICDAGKPDFCDTVGCKEACKALQSMSPIQFPPTSWGFPNQPVIRKIRKRLVVKWKKPTSWIKESYRDSDEDQTDIIYGVRLKLNSTGDWRLFEMTYNTKLVVRGFMPSSVTVIAIGSHGVLTKSHIEDLLHAAQTSHKHDAKSKYKTVTQSKPKYTEEQIRSGNSKPSIVSLQDEYANDYYDDNEEYYDDGSSSNAIEQVDLGLNVEVVWKNSNSLVTTVFWNEPHVGVPPTEYTVYWFLKSCNYKPIYPFCEEPLDYSFKIVKAKNEKRQQITLPTDSILFNSKYKVLVEYTSSPSNTRKASKKIFTTPGCHNPDPKFTKCLSESDTNGMAMEKMLDINITCMVYIPHTKKVYVHLKWDHPAINGSHGYNYTVQAVQYTVVLMNNSQIWSVEKKTTDESVISLPLNKDVLYDVMVEAVVDETSDEDYKTNYLRINTSMSVIQAYNSSCTNIKDVVPEPHTSKKQASPEKHGAMVRLAAIIGCGVLALWLILTLVIFVVVRRRNKPINISATDGCAQSNSYRDGPSNSISWYTNGLYHPALSRDGVGKTLAQWTDRNIMNGHEDTSGTTRDRSTGTETTEGDIEDSWELDPHEIIVGHALGSGAFGQVVTGYIHGNKVAIKLVKGDIPQTCKDDLLAEIAVMKSLGRHPHVVELIGACTLRTPIGLILEYMPYGCLLDFLRKCRKEGELMRDETDNGVAYSVINEEGLAEDWHVTSRDMLSFARQVALAMEFLSEKQFIHRDVAARNVLVSYNKVVKICDFGLSRFVFPGEEYHKLSSGKLPLKWMALESLGKQVYTSSSDVWGFGILLWEIVTMGASPYPNIPLGRLYSALLEGYRMPQPCSCADELYNLMMDCWQKEPQERPTFTKIRQRVDSLLSTSNNYLDIMQVINNHEANRSDCEIEDTSSGSVQLSKSSISLDGDITVLHKIPVMKTKSMNTDLHLHGARLNVCHNIKAAEMKRRMSSPSFAIFSTNQKDAHLHNDAKDGSVILQNLSLLKASLLGEKENKNKTNITDGSVKGDADSERVRENVMNHYVDSQVQHQQAKDINGENIENCKKNVGHGYMNPLEEVGRVSGTELKHLERYQLCVGDKLEIKDACV